MKLLSIGSDSKTIKGEPLGYRTAILYLAPHTLAGGINLCPWSTAECRAACLYSAGRGGFSTVQQARIDKTKFFLSNREGFLAQLWVEIVAFSRATRADGLAPALRLNGTSDVRWHKHGLIERAKYELGVQCYDYTKNPDPARLPGYHQTLSYTGHNRNDAVRWLVDGRNISVVYSIKPKQELPMFQRIGNAEWPVIDGDNHDLRFLDPASTIVGLRAKGSARGQVGKFVVQPGEEL